MIDKEIANSVDKSICTFLHDNIDLGIIYDRQFDLDSQDIFDDIANLTWDVLNDS